MHGRALLVTASMLSGCQQPAPATLGDDASVPSTERVFAGPSERIDAAPPASPVARAPAAPSVERSAPRLEHAAALDATRVFAVGGGRLYRLAGDRWLLAPIEGAEPRDVVVDHGQIYVLARGTGANLGRALVIRGHGADDLLAVATPVLGAGSDPRVLAVARDGEYYLGGEAPALAHVVGNDASIVVTPDPRVVEICHLRDDTVVARHGPERVTVARWGEASSATVVDYLDTIVDPAGAGYLVHTHGEISRGRPGREIQPLTTPVSFAPRVAAALGHELVIVGAGGPFVRWRHHAWRPVVGAFPPNPIAVLPTDPVLVVGDDGAITAVQGDLASVRVASGALPASTQRTAEGTHP